MRRFLHIIHADATDHWQELREEQVLSDSHGNIDGIAGPTDWVHCLYATPHDTFTPDHCDNCEVHELP